MKGEHYYTKEPSSRSDPESFERDHAGRHFRFETDHGVFSIGEADTGSVILLDSLPESLKGNVLDLGCGWGLIGITVAATYPDTHVTMTDINERAVMLANKNAALNNTAAECFQSDGFENIGDQSFDWILTNPPIRAGKQTIYRLFHDAADHLCEDGVLRIVIRKQQGAESCIRYLQTIYLTVTVVCKNKGYWILECKGGKTDV